MCRRLPRRAGECARRSRFHDHFRMPPHVGIAQHANAHRSRSVARHTHLNAVSRLNVGATSHNLGCRHLGVGQQMDLIVVKNATCTYCGCLCDDIELHANHERILKAKRACVLGRAWFFNHPVEHGLPAALIDGRPAEVGAALEAAAAILNDADMPLIYGLGNSTSESQRAAMMLAESIGGVIDSHTSLTHGPSKIAGQLAGKLTCTLGEVKNRADFLVYWGTNPVETHPRHFTKFALRPKGK